MLSYETNRSEYIIKGNGPSILIVSFAAFGIYAECIFPVKVNILLQCYICHSIPEAYIGSSRSSRNCQIAENIRLETGAAEEYTPIDIIVSYIDSKGARLFQVQLSVADACIPRSVITGFSSSILPVFAECAEFAHRNSQIRTNQFIVIPVSFLEYKVIHAEPCKPEVISTAGIICISILNLCCSRCIFKIGCIELTETGCQPELTVAAADFSAVKVVGITIEPAALIAEVVCIAAKLHIDILAEAMVYKKGIHIGLGFIRTGFPEIHIGGQTALYISGIIDLSLYVDAHTAGPGILVKSLVLITHTGITGPVNIADFLFQIGYANAQISQFVCIFAGKFVQGSLLFPVQLIFLRHETGYDLSDFITGHVSFTLEGAVRITFYDALSGQIGYSLVGPVIRRHIGKRIGCKGGNTGGQCRSSSDGENFFIVFLLQEKIFVSPVLSSGTILSGFRGLCSVRVTVFPLHVSFLCFLCTRFRSGKSAGDF